MPEELENKDVDLISKFLDWQVDMRMRERDYGPERYAEHLKAVANERAIQRAIAMIDKYDIGTVWEPEMLHSLRDILKGEK